MSGDSPHGHATLVRSNDRFVTASINLGQLLYIRRYSSWHADRLYEIRFRHGSMDVAEEMLTQFAQLAQEALCNQEQAS